MKNFCYCLLVIISSCNFSNQESRNKKKSGKEIVVLSGEEKSSKGILDRALEKGDTLAFEKVFYEQYLLPMKEDELLYYALRMANKYKSAKGHYLVYLAFNSYKSGENLDKLDDKTKALALYYLLKSYELGYKFSKQTIKEHFGQDSEIPKSSYFISKFADEY